jgi:hypothetical protein
MPGDEKASWILSILSLHVKKYDMKLMEQEEHIEDNKNNCKQPCNNTWKQGHGARYQSSSI